MFFIRFLFLLIFMSFGCKKTKEKHLSSPYNDSNIIYNFKKPELLNLDFSLKEISGLAFANKHIYTHNDEEGKLFKLNPYNGKVITKYNFGKNADYEGVEIINNEAIIIKSNGNITTYNLKTKKTEILKTEFEKHNNIEGLCYDSQQKALLIACKGQLLNGDTKNKTKAIYSLDLNKKHLNKNPFLVIKDEVLKKQFKSTFTSSQLSKKKLKKLELRVLDFSPSGISIHPNTKEYYIISAKGSSLLIFDIHKELKKIIFLNEKQLPQPEGICFDTKANLYISTEGKINGGRIYKYNYVQ